MVYALRAAGIAAECDHMGRSLRAQMKYADRLGVKYTMVLGDDELEKGVAVLKDMAGDGDTGRTARKNWTNTYDQKRGVKVCRN